MQDVGKYVWAINDLSLPDKFLAQDGMQYAQVMTSHLANHQHIYLDVGNWVIDLEWFPSKNFDWLFYVWLAYSGALLKVIGVKIKTLFQNLQGRGAML